MGLCVCSTCRTVSCLNSPVSRDDPRKGSALIVSNDPSTGCELKLEAQHIFAAIK